MVGGGREVAAAVVVVGLGAVGGLVGWLACWKKERLASFSFFGRAQPSQGRANSCNDPSYFRPSFLQEQAAELDTASTILT